MEDQSDNEFHPGLVLEKWTLISPAKYGRLNGWKCRCVCGNETVLPCYRIGRISKSCRQCAIRKHGRGVKKLTPGDVHNTWEVVGIAEDAPSADIRRLWVKCTGCGYKYNHVERRLLNQAATCTTCNPTIRKSSKDKI